MIIYAFAITTFIAANPGITAAFVGVLLSGLVMLIASYWTIIARRLDKLEHTDASIDNRVKEVEATLVRYEEHVGAGDAMFKQLMARVERHMTEEEDQVWGGMKELGNKMGIIHEDNLKAHAAIVERIARMESKLPNGELAKLMGLVQTLVDRA